MWTYLALLIGGSALLGVFLRRVVLELSGKHVFEPVASVRDLDLEEEIEKTKEKKVKISKDDKETLEELIEKANRLVKVGKDDDAIRLFIQALAIDENNKEALHNLAMLYMRKQMFSPASALFKQLVALTEDALHYSHLGLSFYHQQLFEEAKIAYQKAVELDNTRPQRFVSLCQVYRSLNQPQSAIIALGKAMELEKDNLEFLLLLADLNLELGEAAEAQLIINKVLSIDEENQHAKAMLSEIKKSSK